MNAEMDVKELQELRNWSAEKVMGWRIIPQTIMGMQVFGGGFAAFEIPNEEQMPISNWQPDNPTSGQIWMVVDRMRELGWRLKLDNCGESIFAMFESPPPLNGDPGESYSSNPCLAILKAARVAVKEK